MRERPWFRHYDGVPTSIDYEELPLPALLQRTAERCPDRTAIAFENARLTWSELCDHVDRLAAALASMGVREGKTVAIMLPNLPQAVIGYYAALAAGARVVLTNPLYTEPEIEHHWNDAGCSVAIVMDFLWEGKLREMRERLPVRRWIVASIPEFLRFPLNVIAPFKLRRADPPLWARIEDEPNVHRFLELVRATPAEPPRPEIDLDSVALLQYTGGTTGVSKGAMLSHRNLTVNAQQCVAVFVDLAFAREVTVTALPLFHVFGMTVCMNLSVAIGATMVLLPNPRDVKKLVRAVVRHRATLFPGVPALFNALNHFKRIERANLSSLRACLSGSAPISPDVLERFEALTGARILEGFGMTETSPVTHVNPLRGLRKIGTVGVPIPDTDARIVDVDTGERTLETGEEGELVVRGPQVMLGYWRRPDETANALRDGWMFTGDLAAVDDDGFFRIVGRKKDMINCNGLKVFPDEVDDVLVSHDAILEAATIGVPDPERIEIVKSFVVLAPKAKLDAEAVRAFCKERLAPYKVPREVEFLDELPKSTVLKVLRRELRERELRKRSAASAG